MNPKTRPGHLPVLLQHVLPRSRAHNMLNSNTRISTSITNSIPICVAKQRLGSFLDINLQKFPKCEIVGGVKFGEMAFALHIRDTKAMHFR